MDPGTRTPRQSRRGAERDKFKKTPSYELYQSEQSVMVGFNKIANGSLVAIRVAGVVSSPTGEDVTGKWLCEQKKGWGCIDVDEGDLESQIPLVSIFRVITHPPQIVQDRQHQLVSLQSYNSGYFLSRGKEKEKDVVSRAKIGKLPESLLMSGHPVWQMYRSRQSKPAPLYIKEGTLHCGLGHGTATWEIFPLDQARLTNRAEPTGKEKKDKEAKGQEKGGKFFKRPHVRKRSSVAPGTIDSSDPSPTSDRYRTNFPTPEDTVRGAVAQWLGDDQKISEEQEQKAREANWADETGARKNSRQSFSGGEGISSARSRRTGRDRARQACESELPPWVNLPPDISDHDRLFVLLKSTMVLLGIDEAESNRHMKAVEYSVNKIPKKVGPLESKRLIANGLMGCYENIIKPLQDNYVSVKNVVLLQSVYRGFKVRINNKRVLDSLTTTSMSPKEALKSHVEWARSLMKASEAALLWLRIFAMDRIEPLRAAANENTSEDSWIDLLTVDALFSALLAFARHHQAWHIKLMATLENDWPSISGALVLMDEYIKSGGEAIMELAHQTQAIYETFENLRSLKVFMSYSRPATLGPRHDPIIEELRSAHEQIERPAVPKLTIKVNKGRTKSESESEVSQSTTEVEGSEVEEVGVESAEEKDEAGELEEEAPDFLRPPTHPQVAKLMSKFESPSTVRTLENSSPTKSEPTSSPLTSRAFGSAKSFWNQRVDQFAPPEATPQHPKAKSGPVEECPKYLPGFGAGAGLCRRCKHPATSHDQPDSSLPQLRQSEEMENETPKDKEDKEDKEDKSEIEEREREGKKEEEKEEGKFVLASKGKKLDGEESARSSLDAPERRTLMGTFRRSYIQLHRDNSDFSFQVLQMAGGQNSRQSIMLKEQKVEEDPFLDVESKEQSGKRKKSSAFYPYAPESSDNSSDFLDFQNSKPFRWFISLPFEYLQFVHDHAATMCRLISRTSDSEWAREYVELAKNVLKETAHLQSEVLDAISKARLDSTRARLEQISDFNLPDYDSICGDGPLRMLLVESNVVLFKDGALIERHLLMFTDIILLLRRSPRDGKWELHQDFGGVIYFGLVKEVEVIEGDEGGRTVLTFVDINRKSDKQTKVEFWGRHEEETRLWYDRFRERTDANHVVFGKSVADVLQQEEGTVPYIIKVTIDELLERGTEAEGIFRLAGNLKHARYLRVLFDKGMHRYVHPDVLKEEQVHTLAALLKMYLRELPEPLFSVEQYSRAMEMKGGMKIKQMLKEMEASNRVVLLYVMRLLRLVSLNQEKTKMGAYNLAIVFSPNLFQPPPNQKETPESCGLVTSIVQGLIEYFVRTPEALKKFS